jgi:hypothetical protein
VGGGDQGESKDERPGEDDTFEHSSPSALGRESVGRNGIWGSCQDHRTA